MHTTFLGSVTDGQLEAAIITALKTNVARTSSNQVARQQLAYTAIQSLKELTGWMPNEASQIAENIHRQYLNPVGGGTFDEGNDVRRIESAVWALIHRGVVYPRFNITAQSNPIDPRNPPWMIQYLVLTEYGKHLLAGEGASPFQGDFVGRVLSGIADFPQEARMRLEDSHDCWRGGLLRASVVMLGLAYEQVAMVIFDTQGVLSMLVGTALHSQCTRGNAKAILDGLLEALRQRAQPKQPLEADSLAITTAHEVRLQRNRAAHDWARSFDDRQKVEDLLNLGSHKLPELWAIRARL